MNKGKGKGPVLATVLLTQLKTHDQMHFTILKVAADWHELTVPQHTMQPSIARFSKQLYP